MIDSHAMPTAEPAHLEPITTPAAARLAMRRGDWTGPTTYKLPGYVQCNLVVLPRAEAYDFLLFCQRNPEPCPVLEVTDPGDPEPRRCAPGADLRTDLPRYAVYRQGQCVEEPTDIRHLWREDSVAFLLGSSLTFDAALSRAGVTPQRVALQAQIDGMMTHCPGHGFITDLLADQFCLP